ncbi:adenylyl-sulfate kinase [Helicobacter didelphidarum]|uniref:Adenylyl-sulfate kinase n=1 Tax=Helicobacter didelphidarum TaxID=2040648 RepID=A0A3D8IPH3_9HELI|nr:adenylyl-sulfate kinase [Helicobacter didelphidarum]RDU67013.1 adenylyl-sulfate kinase [Helicobacter didelphidarum]
MQGLIFITGLSGSGKSTLSYALIERLYKNLGIKAILLDGDSLRECVGNTDYSKEGRERMSMYYMKTAQMLVNQGFIVVLASISMFENTRQFGRHNIPNYLEIYLEVSKEILASRDSKGLYKNNEANIAGINQNIELPTSSDIVLKDKFDRENVLKIILAKIKKFK